MSSLISAACHLRGNSNAYTVVLKRKRNQEPPYAGCVQIVPDDRDGGVRVVTVWKDGNGHGSPFVLSDLPDSFRFKLAGCLDAPTGKSGHPKVLVDETLAMLRSPEVPEECRELIAEVLAL